MADDKAPDPKLIVRYTAEVERLRANFRTGKTKPFAWRKTQLERLQAFLEEKNDAICEALWKDLRKGPFEAGLSEQGLVINEIKHALGMLGEWMTPEPVSTPLVSQPGRSEIRHDPYGVVLIMSAWNYPINLLLAPAVGALAAGNAVVLKPSELSPATSKVVAEWLPKYLDPDAVVVIEGAVPETQALLSVPFDYIFFTGSGTVGKIVMSKAAEHLTPVTLELGGKSPAIVTDHVSIAVAARRIAWGKFMNGGQTCIAPDYVLVDASVEAEFLAELKKSILGLYGADPKTSPDYCRIVNDRNFQRITALMKSGEIVHGGGSDAKERYIAPTVLSRPAADSPVMQEEIFGPVLPVLAVHNLDEAIAFVNSRAKPLSLYLFTDRGAERERVLEETSAGGVCVNDVIMHMPSHSLPFGGVGPSGMGNYHGKRSFETFTHAKAVMIKHTWLDIPIRYAPYTKSKMKWALRLS